MTNCLSCQFYERTVLIPGLWSMVRTSDAALLNHKTGGMPQLTFFLSLGVSFSSLYSVMSEYF